MNMNTIIGITYGSLQFFDKEFNCLIFDSIVETDFCFKWIICCLYLDLITNETGVLPFCSNFLQVPQHNNIISMISIRGDFKHLATTRGHNFLQAFFHFFFFLPIICWPVIYPLFIYIYVYNCKSCLYKIEIWPISKINSQCDRHPEIWTMYTSLKCFMS